MSDIPTTHTLPEDALRLMRTAFRMDPRSARCLEEAEAEITRLRADLAAAQEREQRMREALERLASMEGFSGNFRMKPNNEAAELKARIDFALAALGEPQ